MPCLKIFTSLAKDKIPENFVHKMVPLLSNLLRKPESKFVVFVSPDCQMSVGGQAEKGPGAVATLESIGNLGFHENKMIIKEVTAFIQNELGIAPENFMMSFYDVEAQNIGMDGQTAARGLCNHS